MNETLVTRRVLQVFTGGEVGDPEAASLQVDQWLPPTAYPVRTVAIVDLGGKMVSAAALREVILKLGQRVRGGVYGELRIVIATSNQAVREVIVLLAREHELPLFISDSTSSSDIDNALPAGSLTIAELETMERLRNSGWRATVSFLAAASGLGPTAATNRLVNLERKGYVYRIQRGRRQGDLFVDPRTPMDVPSPDEDIRPIGDALLQAGISSNPYDTSPLVLHGEHADIAADILRRRGRAE